VTKGVEDPRQRFAEQCLAGSRRADEQDVALGDRRAVAARGGDFLEMRIDRHGDHFLRVVLTDHELVERLDDGTR
jgi:hypothetical protein